MLTSQDAGECSSTTDFRAHQIDPEHETMQEGQPRSALERLNSRVWWRALLVGSPGLKRAAGNVKRFGRLTQGESLGLQREVLIEELSTLSAIPAWGVLIIASLRVLDDGSHSDLLLHPSHQYCSNGSGWRGRQLLSTLIRVESLIFWGAHRGQVAGPMIEAP